MMGAAKKMLIKLLINYEKCFTSMYHNDIIVI